MEFSVKNIRSIGVLNSINNTFILTPVFKHHMHPVKVRISKDEYNRVRGNDDSMKTMVVSKLTDKYNNRVKLVVVNEHTLGYINPIVPRTYSILHASILKGAAINDRLPSAKNINKSDNIRLASEKDFDDFKVSFKGFDDLLEYEYKV